MMKHKALLYGAALAALLLLIPAGRAPVPSQEDAVLQRTLMERQDDHFWMQRRFFRSKKVDLSAISQYDALIRQAADSIGWDWRLLAAVVYHESRFHNDATSPKGARGLMQIRSNRYTAEELLNPARNLSIGTRYLRKLENRYLDAAGEEEAVKFALASFNLGDGRVEALIARAAADSLDASRWDSVATLLPEGHHTVSYVNNVLNTYAYYSRLYPR